MFFMHIISINKMCITIGRVLIPLVLMIQALRFSSLTHNLSRKSGIFRKFPKVPPKNNDLLRFSDKQIEAISYNWVKRWVFDLNLCPWSGKVLAEKSLKVVVSHATKPTDIEALFLTEAKNLLQHDHSHPPTHTTALIVLPHLTNFHTFLDIYSYLEDILLNPTNKDEEELAVDIQLANFHPDYQFQGTKPSDVDNYTNRSPFPMIHILRYDDVHHAIETYKAAGKDTDDVWRRNIDLMKSMGREKIKSLQNEIINTENDVTNSR